MTKFSPLKIRTIPQPESPMTSIMNGSSTSDPIIPSTKITSPAGGRAHDIFGLESKDENGLSSPLKNRIVAAVREVGGKDHFNDVDIEEDAPMIPSPRKSVPHQHDQGIFYPEEMTALSSPSTKYKESTSIAPWDQEATRSPSNSRISIHSKKSFSHFEGTGMQDKDLSPFVSGKKLDPGMNVSSLGAYESDKENIEIPQLAHGKKLDPSKSLSYMTTSEETECVKSSSVRVPRSGCTKSQISFY
jgi:hypothetical protein